MEILAQIFGGIGLIIMVIGMQFRRKKNMLLAQIITNSCYIIQYFLLGAFTGAFTFIVNNIRSTTFFFYSKSRKKPNVLILIFFSSLSIVIGLSSFTNIISFIPVISSVITTYGAWQKEAKIFRIAIMVSSFILIFHDLYFGAYTGMLSYTLTFSSTLIGFIKYNFFKKDKVKTKSV